ncbi:MAG: FAD-dependent oxidoreductase [Oscillospiraceae bacterium]|nr:FAD-dependent oxidoreductase [Oscillospiraceae bacterium]
MNSNLRHEKLSTQLCVIGGGLAGSFAALAAARRGTKVILIQDRPMLGGNASSEIRMWVRGAQGIFNRESGLISELEERNIHGNPTLVHSLFDATLYGMLRDNPNIQILLNCSCSDAKMNGTKIQSVTAWQSTTYTWFTVEADIFMDCSGDSILAPLTGAEYRHGRESKDEFGETMAQETEDSCTMGMSIILAARETDHPVKFTPPAFASYYPTDESFSGNAIKAMGDQTRDHNVGTSKCNLWWVELGGNMDTIHDADRLRDRLLANIYGVWDHIKNHGDHGKENWDLEWVGFLPGKRESRRYIGDVIVTEHDVIAGGHFEDEVAYGGWPLDDHNPYGMEKNPYSNAPSYMIPLKEPYGIPYRALYSKNIENLMFAGRNISVTHAALSSCRVMATCALLGQACGTGAAIALQYGCSPRGVYTDHLKELQSALLEDGVFLPHIARTVSQQTLRAKLNISDAEREVLFNGIERPRKIAGENGIVQQVGGSLSFTFDEAEQIGSLRLRFDPDYSRRSVSDNMKMRVFAMKLHTGKDFVPVRVANTIVKDFVIYADGAEVCRVENNYLSHVTIPLNISAKEIRIQWLATNGAEEVRLFAADFI